MRLFPVPSPRRHLNLPEGRAASDMRHPERYRSYSTLVLRWLERNAFRLLRLLEKDDQPRPAADALNAWMLQLALNAGVDDHLDLDELESLADKAASFVQDTFSSAYFETRAAWGRKSRRGPSFVPEQLDGLDHLSKAEQAAQLGCSTATIARLRRIREERRALAQQAQDELSVLLSEDVQPLTREEPVRLVLTIVPPAPEPEPKLYADAIADLDEFRTRKARELAPHFLDGIAL